MTTNPPDHLEDLANHPPAEASLLQKVKAQAGMAVLEKNLLLLPAQPEGRLMQKEPPQKNVTANHPQKTAALKAATTAMLLLAAQNPTAQNLSAKPAPKAGRLKSGAFLQNHHLPPTAANRLSEAGVMMILGKTADLKGQHTKAAILKAGRTKKISAEKKNVMLELIVR